jgi:hypothetical protein
VVARAGRGLGPGSTRYNRPPPAAAQAPVQPWPLYDAAGDLNLFLEPEFSVGAGLDAAAADFFADHYPVYYFE